ncbi:MAG: tetratricopeptide repeat protein [Bacteroidales bacterium]|nr:tetratricopeptide repeat protein [Bacteroidales bacterium]
MLKYFLIFIFSFFVYSVHYGQKDTAIDSLKIENSYFEYKAILHDALKQKMLGNYSEAMNLFLKCLEINPSSATAMSEISKILYYSNDYEGAIVLLKKAVLNDPKNVWYNLFLSELYKQKRNYKAAIEIFQNLSKYNPENLIYKFEIATLYLLSGNKNKSLSIYNEIEKNNGLNSALLDEKLGFYEYLKDNNGSIETLEILINLYPEEPNYIEKLVTIYLELKDYQKALPYLDRLQMFYQHRSSVLLTKASIYSSIGQRDSTIKIIKEIFNDKNFNPATKISLFKKEFSLAKDSLEIPLKDSLLSILENEHPDFANLHLLKADFYLQNNDFTNAKTSLYNFLKLDNSVLKVYEQLIYLENADKNLDSVISIADKGLEVFPNQSVLYFYKAYALIQKEVYEEAISILNAGLIYAVEADSKVQFHTYIAEAYYKLDRKKEAYDTYEKILKISPSNALILNNYSYYLSVDEIELNKALEMSILSNSLEIDNFMYLDTQAWVLFKLKKYVEAKVLIEKSINLGGNEHAEILEHYGDILYELGKKKDALVQWKKASEIDASNKNLILKINTNSINE